MNQARDNSSSDDELNFHRICLLCTSLSCDLCIDAIILVVVAGLLNELDKFCLLTTIRIELFEQIIVCSRNSLLIQLRIVHGRPPHFI